MNLIAILVLVAALIALASQRVVVAEPDDDQAEEFRFSLLLNAAKKGNVAAIDRAMAAMEHINTINDQGWYI